MRGRLPSSESLLNQLKPFAMRLGLERVQGLVAALGDPHLAVPVVLVAGTNGKGSTASLLATFCRVAGYRTGLYTSPHLETITERLQIDGMPIEDRRLAGLVARCLDVAEELGGEAPTHFEALTVAAFLQFCEAPVDLAIMEIGLGGRLDATNVATPELSVITSISLDHEQHLGKSLESVAREKGGILRRDRPAIAWGGDETVRRVLSELAAVVGADLAFVDPAAAVASTPAVACPQQVSLETDHAAYALELFLPGRHQLGNLSLAVAAAEVLSRRGWAALDAAAIRHGTASCRWPGRLEWVELGDGRQVLLDAAHNAAGLEALVDYLDPLGARPDLLFGALAEKSIDSALPRLAAAVGRVVVTRSPVERSAPPGRWERYFAKESTHIEPDLERALDDALAACGGTLLVCGSLFLVGRVRGLLRERFGVPPAAGQGSPS